MKVKLLSSITQSDITKKSYVPGDMYECKNVNESIRLVESGMAEHTNASSKAASKYYKDAQKTESEKLVQAENDARQDKINKLEAQINEAENNLEDLKLELENLQK